MADARVPPANLRAFATLFNIENGLRELIIERLSQSSGAFWFKSRLPGDVLKKYREGVLIERKAKWVTLVPHHPIYYIDFPDLRKIIVRSDNWTDAFERIFQNKDVFESTLFEIEAVRNKVAHNRKVSDGDVRLIENACAKLAKSVGDEKFSELANRCTCTESVRGALGELLDLLDSTYQRCIRILPCGPRGWEEVINEWWFDELYLGGSLTGVVKFFAVIGEYESLPRLRGEGYKIERWVAKSGIHECYEVARGELRSIISEEGHGS